jgi:hypothetical protein
MSGVRALGGEKRAVGDETAPRDAGISGRVALREASEVFFSAYNLPAHGQSDNAGCLPVRQIKGEANRSIISYCRLSRILTASSCCHIIRCYVTSLLLNLKRRKIVPSLSGCSTWEKEARRGSPDLQE